MEHTVSAYDDDLKAIARMVNGTTPVHAFSIDHPIDLDLFLAE